jgi:polysaccharide biosynthesis transport protein
VSIVQFLRILWARRWIVVAATVSSMVGAAIVVLLIPPRWEAHSRVMLDLIKPDPLTGEVIGANSRPYAATQIELVKDYAVAGQVADQLGWVSDPTLIEEFQHRPASDQRDFRRWIAQQVIDRTSAELVEGSNILEITYTATTPGDAKAVADALMKAYVDTSIAFRRQSAARDADWFDTQSKKAKDSLDDAANAEAAFEKQTGLMLQDDKTDVDTARLRALAGQGAATGPVITPFSGGGSSAGSELAQVDAAISQASQTLGPNHPELVALRAKRAALAAQDVQERALARASAGAAASAASAGVGAVNQAMAAEKTKVMGQADKIERLKELHAEVELRRDEYNKMAARAADLRQEAAIGETGLTMLGSAVTPQHPAFPNKPLIFGGSLGLGLAVGVLVGLLMELFGRRVRGVEDLSAIDAPVLAIIPAAATPVTGAKRVPRQPATRRWWGRARIAEA